MSDPIERRLQRLEWRINALIGIALVQTAILVIGLISDMIPSALTLIGLLTVVMVLAYAFRRQIPEWIGAGMRWLYANAEKESHPSDATDQRKPRV